MHITKTIIVFPGMYSVNFKSIVWVTSVNYGTISNTILHCISNGIV